MNIELKIAAWDSLDASELPEVNWAELKTQMYLAKRHLAAEGGFHWEVPIHHAVQLALDLIVRDPHMTADEATSVLGRFR